METEGFPSVILNEGYLWTSLEVELMETFKTGRATSDFGAALWTSLEVELMETSHYTFFNNQVFFLWTSLEVELMETEPEDEFEFTKIAELWTSLEVELMETWLSIASIDH